MTARGMPMLFLLITTFTLCWIPIHTITAQNTIGLRIPPPRFSDQNTAQGLCGGGSRDSVSMTGPKSALYYGSNQVGLSVTYAPNSIFEFRLLRYLTTPVNGSVPTGSWNGTALYSEPYSNTLLLNTLTNQSLPQGYPIPVDNNGIQQPVGSVYQTTVEIDIPNGITCTPICSLQMKATINGIAYTSCSDVVLLSRIPVCKYLSLRAEGCCPLSVSTLSRRISSALSTDGFVGTSIPNYVGEDQFLTNTWEIQDQQDAPYTLRINPLTGLYAAKLCVDDTFNRTSASLLQRFQQQQQAVSLALSSGSGPTDIIVQLGDIPDTYVGYNAGSSTYPETLSLTFAVTLTLLLLTTTASPLRL